VKAVFLIGLASILFYLASSNAGKLLFRFVSIPLYREERRYLSFISGTACLSGVVFLVTALGLAYRGVFWGLLLAPIAAGTYFRGKAEKRFQPLDPPFRFLFLACYLVYAALYSGYALLPETSPDGTAYHLGFVAEYARLHSLPPITTSIYASLPQGMEMLFLVVFGIGKQSAGAMVHAIFLLTLPLGMLCYARRFGFGPAGVAGGLLVFLSPVVGRDGTSAYVDVALASVAFAVVYLGEIWRQHRDDRLLFILGFLAGFSMAIKYTGFPAFLYAAGLVAFEVRSRNVAPKLALLSLAAAVSLGPWLVKNAVVVHNPVAPFANSLFPNPYVHVSFERDYIHQLANMSGVQFWQIPVEACIRGYKLQGLLGPLFLLAPLALFAVGKQHARNLVLAGALFLIPYPANIGTRFLLPSAIFFMFAAAIAFARFRAVLFGIVLLQAVLSWPSVVAAYSDRYAWRFEPFNWKAALRLTPEPEYLNAHLGGAWEMGRRIENAVPPQDAIFCLGTFPSAYVRRTVIQRNESAFGEVALDGIYGAAFGDRLLARNYILHTAPVRTGKVRVVQAGTDAGSPWSVNEIRISDRGAPLIREPLWLVTALPNHWDAGLAFDNNPATRWQTWEPYRPGMFLEVNFGGDRELDAVTVESSGDAGNSELTLEIFDHARWVSVPVAEEVKKVEPPGNVGRAAMDWLKSQNIHWLLAYQDDWAEKELARNRFSWGVQLVSMYRGYRLYRILP
jgi:Dolichyl-phosphate-mannose-protein mannosyltransferase